VIAGTFLNIAHRGARAFAPENTLPAIRMAQRLGSNAIEIDVQMSRDGELIVIHDDELSRCTDVETRFRARTHDRVGGFMWADGAVLDAGSWYDREIAKPLQERQRCLRDLSSE